MAFITTAYECGNDQKSHKSLLFSLQCVFLVSGTYDKSYSLNVKQLRIIILLPAYYSSVYNKRTTCNSYTQQTKVYIRPVSAEVNWLVDFNLLCC